MVLLIHPTSKLVAIRILKDNPAAILVAAADEIPSAFKLTGVTAAAAATTAIDARDTAAFLRGGRHAVLEKAMSVWSIIGWP